MTVTIQAAGNGPIVMGDDNQLFHKQRSPEENEQRKRCILLARDYYLAVEIANEQLEAVDRLHEPQAVIDHEKIQIYRNLLKIVEKCLARANWDVSLFFQNIGQRIQTMRDKIQDCLTAYEAEIQAADSAEKSHIQKEGMILIYVSLYQSDGDNLRKWAALLDNITRLSIGRPVYRDESAVIHVIRAKAEPKRDAYVAVYVSEDDIIEPLGGIQPRDRAGNELLTVREGTIKPENIFEFVHNNASQILRYQFKKNKLIPKLD